MDKSKITQDQLDKLGKRFANALLKDDQGSLNEITRYKGGSSGSMNSNISNFKRTGADTYIGATPLENKGLLVFGKGREPTCVIVAEIEDDSHISSDWSVLKK